MMIWCGRSRKTSGRATCAILGCGSQTTPSKMWQSKFRLWMSSWTICALFPGKPWFCPPCHSEHRPQTTLSAKCVNSLTCMVPRWHVSGLKLFALKA